MGSANERRMLRGDFRTRQGIAQRTTVSSHHHPAHRTPLAPTSSARSPLLSRWLRQYSRRRQHILRMENALVTHTGSTRPLYISSSQTQSTPLHPYRRRPPPPELASGCDTYSSSSLYSHSRCESQYHSGSGYHSHSCSTNSRSQTANIQVLQAAPCSRLPGTPRTLRFPRLGQDALVLSRRLTSSRVSWDAEDDDFWERFEFGLGRGRCGKGGFGNDGRRKRCCVGRWMEECAGTIFDHGRGGRLRR